MELNVSMGKRQPEQIDRQDQDHGGSLEEVFRKKDQKKRNRLKGSLEEIGVV